MSENRETKGKHRNSGLDPLVPSAFGLPLTANRDGEAMLVVVLAVVTFFVANHFGCICDIHCMVYFPSYLLAWGVSESLTE